MAIGFDAVGDYARRIANLPSSTAFTICGWAKITSVRSGNYQYFAGMEDAEASSSNYLLMGYDDTGAFQISFPSAPYGTNFGTSPTVGQWFFFALTCAGTGSGNFLGYWAHSGTLNSVSGKGASFTPAMITLANDSYGEYCNIHMSNVRVWGSVLTQTELETEMASATPVKAGELMGWPMANNTDTSDESGNSYVLTLAGTLTTETGPSFSTPANVDALPGGSFASGLQADISVTGGGTPANVDALPGGGLANGDQAIIGVAANVRTLVGDLDGSGTQNQATGAAITQAQPGGGFGSGEQETIGGAVTISASPGGSCGGGAQATIQSIADVAGLPGGGFVAGEQTTIGGGAVITAQPGAGAGDGMQADISGAGAAIINGLAGGSAGFGSPATITGAVDISALPGAGLGSDSQAMAGGAVDLSSIPGGALGSGVEASIDASGSVNVQAQPGGCMAGGARSEIQAAVLVTALVAWACGGGTPGAIESQAVEIARMTFELKMRSMTAELATRSMKFELEE